MDLVYRSLVSLDPADRRTADGAGGCAGSGITCGTTDDGALSRSAHGIFTRRCADAWTCNPVANQGPADGTRGGTRACITGDAADDRTLCCAA
jgi:hypothetical protein